MTTPYKIVLVVDRQFGERLAALEPGIPVWIVSTPFNKSVAERLWKERAGESHLTGITVFNDNPAYSAEKLATSELEDIDLHHGLHSADPPYMIIEVVGTALSEPIRAAFGEYGFDEFYPSPNGFVAVRPLPSNPRV